MASTGLTIAGAGANNADAGDDAWANPGNVTADDGTNASSGGLKGETSQYLHATNFGFSLPTGAVPTGIEVRVQRLQSVGGGTPTIKDHTIQLIKAGSRAGDNKADLATTWPSSATNKDYGGATDLWGTTWTAAQINASNFGVAVRAEETFATSGSIADARVDAIWINVTYRIGSRNHGQVIG